MKTNKRKFFFNDTNGINADIDRHRIEEQTLRERIKQFESEKDDGFKAQRLRVYNHFLSLLLQSKAEVVSKIGKKKR